MTPGNLNYRKLSHNSDGHSQWEFPGSSCKREACCPMKMSGLYQVNYWLQLSTVEKSLASSLLPVTLHGHPWWHHRLSPGHWLSGHGAWLIPTSPNFINFIMFDVQMDTQEASHSGYFWGEDWHLGVRVKNGIFQ